MKLDRDILSRYKKKEQGAVVIIKSSGIELKTTPAELFARILCGILAVLVLLLLIVSLIFSFGNGAPSFFGNNIFIVRNDTFEIIEQGSAVIASKVPYADILPGNIIIYSDENGKAALAEVQETVYIDNIYSFAAMSELGEDLRLTQSQIIGKAMSASRFFGSFIQFAKSPAGVMLIAVIPCFTILGYEVFRLFLYKIKGISPVTPIKKQDEIPTFIPRPKVDKVVSAYKDIQQNKSSDLDNDNNFKPEKKPQITSDYPLYRAPSYNAPKVPPAEKAPVRQMPLSQRRLNEVIAETKKKQSSDFADAVKQPPPANPSVAPKSVVSPNVSNQTQNHNTVELNQTTRSVKSNTVGINENLRQYTPRRQTGTSRINSTQAVPRLDELLKDDSEHDNSGYNIGEILSGFDKNKTE